MKLYQIMLVILYEIWIYEIKMQHINTYIHIYIRIITYGKGSNNSLCQPINKSFGDCPPFEMKLHVLIFGECGVDWLPAILYNLITFAEQFGYRVYPIIAIITWPIQARQTVPILLSVGINITHSNLFRKTQILSWLPIPVNTSGWPKKIYNYHKQLTNFAHHKHTLATETPSGRVSRSGPQGHGWCLVTPSPPPPCLHHAARTYKVGEVDVDQIVASTRGDPR